ncbi:hypothetical protein KY290_038359 [Solanum tuberosum]|uniref:Uncharacterized protein n=1 Tax=Solanum tuberosum TaxID=4113 RepID=A0ABQ7U054_SOLTU|nr:hypothetical protein KY290_038359 [Solanum tuberosum]
MGEDVRLVQQGQVLVLLEHQLNHNQAQREEEVDQEASATERGRGTATGNKIGIGIDVDGSGATGRGRGTGTGLAGKGRGTATGVAGRGRGTGVAATATDVPGATGGGKRPRMVGMGILHTQSGFTIHNSGMPMNSSIVTENLGHHKPRSGLIKMERKGCCNSTRSSRDERK